MPSAEEWNTPDDAPEGGQREGSWIRGLPLENVGATLVMSRLRASIQYLEQIGATEKPGSRVWQAEPYLTGLYESAEPLTLASAEERARLPEIHRTASEVSTIAFAAGRHLPDDHPFTLEKLRQMLGGAEVESFAPTAARDISIRGSRISRRRVTSPTT